VPDGAGGLLGSSRLGAAPLGSDTEDASYGFSRRSVGDTDREASFPRSADGFASAAIAAAARTAAFARFPSGFSARSYGSASPTRVRYTGAETTETGGALGESRLGTTALGAEPAGETSYGFSRPSVGKPSRSPVSPERSAAGFAAPSLGLLSRALGRYVKGHSAASFGEADRDASYVPRPVNGFSSPAFGSASSVVPNWLFGDSQIPGLVEETAEHDSLTLVFAADRALFESRLRPLSAESGEVDVVGDSSGSFTAYDRAGGDNTYQLEPPDARNPPNAPGKYLVADFESEVRDQAAEEYLATVELVPGASRTQTGTVDGSGGRWTLSFETGTVSTDRVSSDVSEQARKSQSGVVLTAVLNGEECRALEESASALGAVRYRSVPDGDEVVEDNSDGSRNTVEIDPPADAPLEPGDYVVLGWTRTALNDDFYEAEMELARE